MLINAAISAVLQVALLGGIPLLGYYAWHRLRHHRSAGEVMRRAGLQAGEGRYALYSLAAAAVEVVIFIAWPPPVDWFTGAGSAQRQFVGLGLGVPAIVMAILYGVVQTGFTEELLFRGLIAGSLARRLPLLWANVVQAGIFLLPHLLILRVAPRMWPVLPAVFFGALFFGWIRIRSRSILGPWLMHAAANVSVAIMVVIRG